MGPRKVIDSSVSSAFVVVVELGVTTWSSSRVGAETESQQCFSYHRTSFSFWYVFFFDRQQRQTLEGGSQHMSFTSRAADPLQWGCHLLPLSWRPLAKGTDTPIYSWELNEIRSPVQSHTVCCGQAEFQTWLWCQGPSRDSKPLAPSGVVFGWDVNELIKIPIFLGASHIHPSKSGLGVFQHQLWDWAKTSKDDGFIPLNESQ